MTVHVATRSQGIQGLHSGELTATTSSLPDVPRKPKSDEYCVGKTKIGVWFRYALPGWVSLGEEAEDPLMVVVVVVMVLVVVRAVYGGELLVSRC